MPKKQESYLDKMKSPLVTDKDAVSEVDGKQSETSTIDFSAMKLDDLNSALDLFSEHPELAEPSSPGRRRGPRQ